MLAGRYQAMIHELIGIKKNRVNLKNVPGIKEELQVLPSFIDVSFCFSSAPRCSLVLRKWFFLRIRIVSMQKTCTKTSVTLVWRCKTW